MFRVAARLGRDRRAASPLLSMYARYTVQAAAEKTTTGVSPVGLAVVALGGAAAVAYVSGVISPSAPVPGSETSLVNWCATKLGMPLRTMYARPAQRLPTLSAN